ncbi:MAG TPA: hypothetical protein VK137_01835 [Planctomycetaceae bacterium]|nr:hypothetical protein [Planctomycetaceae bacterium]
MPTKSMTAKRPMKSRRRLVHFALQPISRGVSARELRAQLGLNRRLFSRLTGYSERAVADWEAGKELSDSTRQRLTEIQRLQRALARVMKSEFVGAWLQAPNPAFEGLKPIEIVERGEIDRLWRMIHRLEAGLPG